MQFTNFVVNLPVACFFGRSISRPTNFPHMFTRVHNYEAMLGCRASDNRALLGVDIVCDVGGLCMVDMTEVLPV